jgi:hypothetical protein
MAHVLNVEEIQRHHNPNKFKLGGDSKDGKKSSGVRSPLNDWGKPWLVSEYGSSVVIGPQVITDNSPHEQPIVLIEQVPYEFTWLFYDKYIHPILHQVYPPGRTSQSRCDPVPHQPPLWQRRCLHLLDIRPRISTRRTSCQGAVVLVGNLGTVRSWGLSCSR